MQNLLPNYTGNKYYLLLRRELWPYNFFDKVISRCGPNMCMSGVYHPQISFFSESHIIKEIFNDNEDRFLTGEVNVVFRPFFGESSTFLTDGPKYFMHRKALLQQLNSYALAQYRSKLESSLTHAIDQVLILNNRSKFDLAPVLEESSMVLMIEVILGIRKGDLYEQIKNAIHIYRENSGFITTAGFHLTSLRFTRGPITLYSEYLAFFEHVKHLITVVIEESRKKLALHSFDKDITNVPIVMGLLLQKDEHGNPFDDQTIYEQIINLILAGFETTMYGLNWLFRWSFTDELIFSKLTNTLLSYSSTEEAAGDEYLNSVILESIRIYPIVPYVLRIAKRDVILGGKYEIKEGNAVGPLIYGAHHMENVFPNSKLFDPMRFSLNKYSGNEYLPFGGGIRRCLGMSLAMYQIKKSVAVLLRNYKIIPGTTKRPKPIRSLVTVHPRGGVPVMMKSLH